MVDAETLDEEEAKLKPVPAPDHSPVALDSVTNPSVNAATDRATSDAELLHLINELKAQMATLQTPTPSPPSGRPGTSFRPRRNTSSYCWSHGACAHKGADCRIKRPGHKDEATFSNKMGAVPIIVNLLVPDGVGWSLN